MTIDLAVSPRSRLPSLTGARWWAAVAVFVLHALVFLPVYPFQKSDLFRTIHWLVPMQLGAAGVTFFFVLSGFVICWSYRQGDSIGNFYRKRILKIYPTHILAAAVFVLAASVPLMRLVVWLPNLVLVHTWVPKSTTVGGLNVPSWSLCAEMLFYLSFPVLAPFVARIPAARIGWAIAGLFVAILLLHTAFYIWADGPKGIANAFAPRLLPGDDSPEFEIHSSPAWFARENIPVSPSYWLSYTFPLSRLPEFYLGVLVARLVAENRWRNTRMAPVLASLCVAYAATWVVPVNYKMSVLMLLPMTALIATVAMRDIRGASRWSATPRMVWLGNVSYAFYMIQFPVMAIVTRVFIGGNRYSATGWLAWTAVVFALSLIAAAAIYRWVDMPIMTRWARPKSQEVALHSSRVDPAR
ncbi:acyltransferase [Antrihabitans stalactiti]|uniref:acyltransferase family protein n=1 Tax=Antrihabitans stalactiti TaxID=2584121 RepID=UPI0030B86884